MGTILSQNGLILLKPIAVMVSGNIIVGYESAIGGIDYSILGEYKSEERAKEVLREIFQTDYYEMPLE